MKTYIQFILCLVLMAASCLHTPYTSAAVNNAGNSISIGIIDPEDYRGTGWSNVLSLVYVVSFSQVPSIKDTHTFLINKTG